jgi:hypothetical protein
LRKFAAVLAVATSLLASLAFGVTSGKAGLSGCGPASYSQPFTSWDDYSSYVLAPGGTFEGPNSWNLAGNAQVVRGNEPYYLNSKKDSRSLVLSPGSSATAPAACIGVFSPTLRLVGKSSDGSAVHVDIYAAGVLGLVKLPTGADISLSSSWDASAIQLLTLQNVLALTNLGTTNIVLRFSPIGSATVQLDDVFIDPMFHE